MPQGNEKPSTKPEVTAREAMTALFCEAMDATKGINGFVPTTIPENWETAAQRFDAAADVCRNAAHALAQQKDPTPAPLSPTHEFLKGYLGGDLHRPHAFNVISIPAGSDIGQILLNAMVKGGNHR